MLKYSVNDTKCLVSDFFFIVKTYQLTIVFFGKPSEWNYYLLLFFLLNNACKQTFAD